MHLRGGLRVERLDDEALVFDRSGEIVHRVTGSAVEALTFIQEGVHASDIPEHLVEAVDSLIQAHLVEDSAGIRRRKLLLAGGATWAAATITTFTLADPVFATTPCPGGVVATDPAIQKYITAGTFTYTTGSGATSLSVRAWGGGGGGGGGGVSTGGGGGGGGGGAYVYSAVVTVTPCTGYTVTVGVGGSGGSKGGAFSAGKSGGGGGKSLFQQDLTLSAPGGSGGIGGAAFNPGDGGSGGTSSVGSVKNSGGNGEEVLPLQVVAVVVVLPATAAMAATAAPARRVQPPVEQQAGTGGTAATMAIREMRPEPEAVAAAVSPLSAVKVPQAQSGSAYKPVRGSSDP